MSENNQQNDAAIEVIDDQLRTLDAEIDASTRRLEVDTAIRGRLLELRATLSRKPRARRATAARVVEMEPPPPAPAADTAPVVAQPLWGNGLAVVPAAVA